MPCLTKHNKLTLSRCSAPNRPHDLLDGNFLRSCMAAQVADPNRSCNMMTECLHVIKIEIWPRLRTLVKYSPHSVLGLRWPNWLSEKRNWKRLSVVACYSTCTGQKQVRKKQARKMAQNVTPLPLRRWVVAAYNFGQALAHLAHWERGGFDFKTEHIMQRLYGMRLKSRPVPLQIPGGLPVGAESAFQVA